MGDCLSGFQDKLYWRQVRRDSLWHCFKKVEGGGFAPLCGASFFLDRSGGQSIARPPSWVRCPQCDAREMERRGWEEGGRESDNWTEHRKER